MKGGAEMKTEKQAYIKRFGMGRIVEHQLNAIVFALLVLTGLSQRFHDYSLSHWIIMTFGGVDSVRVIHRYAGLVFTVLVAVHIVAGSIGVIVKKWPASMVVNLKDFRED